MQAAPTGWSTHTRLNAPAATATERFRVLTKLASADDQDYLAYGYWNRIPLNDLGDYKPFYYGKTPYTFKIRKVQGTGNFEGGATGVYVTGKDDSTTSVAGRFTADVSIKVIYGDHDDDALVSFDIKNVVTRKSDGTGAGPTLNQANSVELQATVSDPSFTAPGFASTASWGGHFYGGFRHRVARQPLSTDRHRGVV